MESGHQPGRVIWTREIDWEAQSARRRKLLRYFVLPAIAAVLIGLVAGGVGAMLGLLIFLGLFGLLLVAYIEGRNFNLRQNRELRVDGNEMVLGKQRVQIPDIERFTTYMTSIESSTVVGGNVVGSGVEAGAAEFLVRVDPPRRTRLGETLADHVTFLWLRMQEADLALLRAAIEPELPVSWIPLEQFREPYSR